VQSLFGQRVRLYIKLCQKRKIIESGEVILVASNVLKQEGEGAQATSVHDDMEQILVFKGARNVGLWPLNQG